jgi:SAM-dependent methyltransferase
MKNKTDMLDYCSGWYETFSGKSSLGQLDELCADIMSETFGYYAIETGVLSGAHDFLQFSRIAAGFSIVSQHADSKSDLEAKVSLIASSEQLPIATDNVDLVVASHVLELSEDPHQVLREIDRVLVPEGHCILIGFNPLVISRMRRLFGSAFKRKKNDYRMRSVPRVRDWFSLLGFEVLDVHYMGVRPGIKNKKLFESLGWLEQLGQYAGPILGNMYVLHVKKQVIAMRPYKKVWKAPAVLSGGKVVLNSTAQKIRRDNLSKP